MAKAKSSVKLCTKLTWLSGIAATAIALVAADLYFEDFGYFRSGASIAAEMDINITDAIHIFDNSCMQQTVYKLKPENMHEAFIANGLTDIADAQYSKPNLPITAYTMARTDDGGYECFIRFYSATSIDNVMAPAFTNYADTRLSRSMVEYPSDFIIEEASENTARPIVRHFADTDVAYYVIFRPDNYSLIHQLQLISIPHQLDNN